MTCDHWSELLSARLDGELSRAESAALAGHLATCGACREHEQRLLALTPSAGGPTVEQVAALPSTRMSEVLRFVLLVVGGTLLAVNLPGIITTAGDVDAHLSRHDGVFGAALGFAMVAVALRPERAIGLLPITGAIALLMAAVAVIDIAAGRAAMLTEATHVLELVGLVCVWGISGGPDRLRRRLGVPVGGPAGSTLPSWPT